MIVIIIIAIIILVIAFAFLLDVLHSLCLLQLNCAPLAQVGCMRQALGPGALGRPGGSGWRGRWEGGSGWGKHVN